MLLNKLKMAAALSKINLKGIKSTEFWSKVVVQLVLIYNSLYKKNLDPQLALAIVGALEGIYPLARSVVKAAVILSEQNKQKV